MSEHGHARSVATTALGSALAAAFFTALLAAAPAQAAVTCAYDDAADTLSVTAGADQDAAAVEAQAGGEIAVGSNAGPVTCTGAGGPPTVNNIGDLTMTGADGEQGFFIQNPAGLAPGNGTTGEIEVVVIAGGGDDIAFVAGTTGNDSYVLGTSGMNWNGDTDLDATFIGVEDLAVFAGDGNDAVTGRGADGTGAPFAGPGNFGVVGGGGNDVLEGGDTGDELFGNEGDDTLRGFGGPDTLGGESGTNSLDGGAGDDLAEYAVANAGVTVDLAITGPQATGDSVDTLTAVEGVSGSSQADTLRGDGAANRLLGQDGNDTLDGRAAADELNGGAGSNTVTYAQAPAGVTVDLQLGTVSGGSGNDTLLGIDTLVGSEFADTIDGSASPDAIDGLGGSDTIAAMAGDDVVTVRDGGPDTASCGDDLDTAIADRASVDSVAADCETINFLPEADPDPGPAAPGGEGGEDRELAFELSGKARQRVLKRKGVVVRAACPVEACTATARGRKVKPRDEALDAGVTERIKLALKKKQLAAIAKALEAGKNPRVKVRASGTDAAGNEATDSLTVKARR